MSTATGVVEDLLDLDGGEAVELEAEQYRWERPYTVDVEDEAEFVTPGGESWRARRLHLVPEDGRATTREIRAVEGCDPPEMGAGYGRLVEVQRVVDDDRCDWLERPADEIVATSAINRDLEEVLRVVERADTWLQVHKRLAGGTVSRTKDLLWQLGLRKSSGALLDEPELQERIDAIREVYVDE